MLHILWSIIVGFVIGLLARAFLPGADHLGLIMTTLVGIGGSVAGGFIGQIINKPAPGAKFHPAGFVMSIICAMGLLYAMRFFH